MERHLHLQTCPKRPHGSSHLMSIVSEVPAQPHIFIISLRQSHFSPRWRRSCWKWSLMVELDQWIRPENQSDRTVGLSMSPC